MTRLAQRARILAAAFDDVRYFPQVPLPVDVTDAERFPEFELARQHLASLSPERRAELNGEWE